MSENPKAMSMVDSGQFEDGAIIRDDDQYLVVKSVLASEIVQPYHDQQSGKTFMAYKPADELEKATLTFRGVPIKALSHPKGSHIEEAEDDNGRVENPVFRKDLMDPKTKRPCRRGIVGDLWFYRGNAPEVKTGNYTAITDDVAQKIRDGTLKDNSIGFNCYTYPTPGEWQGQHYDVVQRRIRGNHLAAPIEKGRCPSPYCGINMDSAEPLTPQVIEVKDADLGISYHFDKAKFTDEQAKLWVEKRTAKDCPVCTRMLEAGLLTAGQRLYKQYGADVLEVIEGHEVPVIVPEKDASEYMTHMTSCIKGGKSMLDCVAEWHKNQSAKTDAAADDKKEKPKDQAVNVQDDVIQKNRQALKDLYSLTELFT